MKLYEQIRKAHEREQLSIRELAHRFGVHRRDVRQALASPVPPQRKTAARPATALDDYKSIIDGWLEADRTAPRKQRHTARRVWQRLVEEHGASVGESTVRRYVAEVRRRMDVPLVEVMVPQHHPLGEEAEVDFGTASVYLVGTLVEVSMFVMRLSASGRGYTRAYLNEAQELFLDGHVRGFEHFGGVPARIRYDNLKAAVERVLKGRDRIESDRFIAMPSHYRFDSIFCQPGIKGSHEKGGVEGEVGRFRRRHLVPVPRVASMSELNELIAAGVARDDLRFITGRAITVGEHLGQAGADGVRADPQPARRSVLVALDRRLTRDAGYDVVIPDLRGAAETGEPSVIVDFAVVSINVDGRILCPSLQRCGRDPSVHRHAPPHPVLAVAGVRRRLHSTVRRQCCFRRRVGGRRVDRTRTSDRWHTAGSASSPGQLAPPGPGSRDASRYVKN